MNSTFQYIMYLEWARSGVLLIGGLLCALWLYRLWRHRGDSACLWMLWGFILLPNLIPAALSIGFLLLFHLAISLLLLFQLGSIDISPPMKLARIIQDNLFPVAQYLCIFMALSKLSNRAVPFAEIAAPIARRFRRSTEPLRSKMP